MFLFRYVSKFGIPKLQGLHHLNWGHSTTKYIQWFWHKGECLMPWKILRCEWSERLFLDGFGRWEKDGSMQQNESVTPSFCRFVFANVFFHMMLACMVLICDWICSNLYHSLPNSPIISRCKGTNLHENSIVSSCFTQCVCVCIWISRSCIAL